MLKALVQYLEQRPEPVIVTHDGSTYSDKELFRVPNDRPDTLQTHTLQSIVDYLVHGVDEGSRNRFVRKTIHVVSPTEVCLLSECQADGKRWKWVQAEALTPEIPFGQFLDVERFNIILQSMFVESPGRAGILSVIGNIADGAVSSYTDDGTTQAVTVRAGIQRVGTAGVPNPVELAPFRTFPEIQQPVSPFVLRLRSGSRDGEFPSAALFEADGAAWRLAAIDGIVEYFRSRIPEKKRDGVVIIA